MLGDSFSQVPNRYSVAENFSEETGTGIGTEASAGTSAGKVENLDLRVPLVGSGQAGATGTMQVAQMEVNGDSK